MVIQQVSDPAFQSVHGLSILIREVKMTAPQADRRRNHRKDVLAPGVIRMEANGKTYIAQAIVKNLSAGGLHAAIYDFEDDFAKQPLENTAGTISFRLTDTGKEYTLPCHTKRVTRLAYTIQLGAEFFDISGDYKQEIEQYCSR